MRLIPMMADRRMTPIAAWGRRRSIVSWGTGSPWGSGFLCSTEIKGCRLLAQVAPTLIGTPSPRPHREPSLQGSERARGPTHPSPRIGWPSPLDPGAERLRPGGSPHVDMHRGTIAACTQGAGVACSRSRTNC